MPKTRLADTFDEISRIQHDPPPLIGAAFLSDTRLSRPWANSPIDTHVQPMRHHVIAAVMRGDGVSNARIEGKWRVANSTTGSITVMPKGQDAYWRCTGSPVCSNVYLSSQRLQRCADEAGRSGRADLVERINALDPKLHGILSLIAAESSVGDAISRLYMEQLIDLLCLQLLRDHSVFPLAEAKRPRGLSQSQIRSITEYMKAHLDQPIGLQEVAELVGLSRFHLCTAFGQATGHTPHQWLVQLRMAEARRLLADMQLSVTDVALAVGYQTPSSFAQAFRNAVGTTPTAFRLQLQDCSVAGAEARGFSLCGGGKIGQQGNIRNFVADDDLRAAAFGK